MYSLFVGGVTHNNRGFEYTVIDGLPLPSSISQYIDIFNMDKMRNGRSYVVQKLLIDSKEYTLFSEYVSINPADQKSSRGSYIAVGILTDIRLSTNCALDYSYRISSMQDALKVIRDSRNAFSVNFSMKNDLQNFLVDHGYMENLAIIVKEISDGKKFKKVIFNSLRQKERTQKIENQSVSGKKSIMYYIKKFIG